MSEQCPPAKELATAQAYLGVIDDRNQVLGNILNSMGVDLEREGMPYLPRQPPPLRSLKPVR